MEHRRNACLVDILLMVRKQVAVEVLGLTESEAEDALNLTTALNHFLTHSKLSVFKLFNFSELVTHLGLQVLSLTSATAEARLNLQQKRLSERTFVIS